jgi:hypothetical protein
MNEKIKELAEQSHLYGYMVHLYNINAESGYRVPLDVRMRALEGFAELIVAECVQMCEGNSEYKNHVDTEWGKGFAAGIELCKEVMKQHFGVKE